MKKIQELYFRRELCKLIIAELDKMTKEEVLALGHTMQMRDSALEEYKSQLARIDADIAAIEGNPPPVVVGLKTARLFGRSSVNQ